MYCYNCGKSIYKGLQHCPYCNITFDEKLLQNVMFINSLKTLSNSMPTISSDQEKKFLIDDLNIIITGDNYIFAYVLNHLNGMKAHLEENITKYISNNHFDLLVKNGEDFIASQLSDVIYLTMSFIYKFNPKKITNENQEIFFDLIQYASKIWEPVYVSASEFEDLHQELARVRMLSKKRRSSYWVGSGIGISGMIQGKIKADIMNIGSSILTTTENVIRGAVQSGFDHSKEENFKNEIRNSWQFRHAILVEFNRFLRDIANLLIKNLCSKNTIDKYMAIYDTVNSEEYPAENISANRARNILLKNPFSINAYTALYAHNTANGKTLSEMASFCGLYEQVYSEFIDFDGTLSHIKFDNGSIGVDTSKNELLKIKKSLITLEINNPAYTSSIYRKSNSCVHLRNSWIKEEQEYHRKVDAYLTLHHINECRAEIEQIVAENDIFYAVRISSKRNDVVFENLLLRKMLALLDEFGTDIFIEKIGSNNLFPIITDAILIHNHTLTSMEKAGLAGRSHVLAHIGKYLYKNGDMVERERGKQYLIEAGKKHDYVGITYLSDFFKKGEGSLPMNEFYSDLCNKIAASYNL